MAVCKNQMSLSKITVGERREIDIESRCVLDCVFVEGSYLLIVCGDKGIFLLDKDYKVQSKLPDYSERVATFRDKAVVTQGNRKQLLYLSVFPELSVTKTIKMDKGCYGVDVFENDIYVTLHDFPRGNGEVQVLNMDGILQRGLGVNGGEFMFSTPDDVKVSKDGSKVFVSDMADYKVTCLSVEGHILYQYSDEYLSTPTGMYVDETDTMLVCGQFSNNVHMITPDGKKEKVFLTESNGLDYPQCILYRPSDSCLLIGLWSSDKPLIVFKTNKNRKRKLKQ